MAMVVVSNRIIDINGKVGGNIYRSDKCGIHVQTTPRTIRRDPTNNQKIRRNAWRALVTNYIKKLTQDQVYAWQDYANRHPRKNRKGETYTLTWWQQFIATNINVYISGGPIDLWPPGY